MPKKRRRPRNRPRATPLDSTADRPADPRGEVRTRPERREPARPGPASRSRAEKKELARQARERAVKTVRRRQATRRAIQIGVVAALAVGVFLFLTQVNAPGDIPASALQAAQAAGCGDVETPVSGTPDRTHLGPGEPFTYDQQPAVAGAHDPSPLPPQPHVYDSPVEETRAVHNLEHAYVLIYYRAEDPDALPDDVVRSLERVARAEEKVIMAPYPALGEGTALALAAWNKLWACPSAITADQARSVATGFIDAYRGTSNAPEANVP